MGYETVMANPQINFCVAPFQTEKVPCLLYNDSLYNDMAVWTNLMFNWPATQCQMNQFKQHMNRFNSFGIISIESVYGLCQDLST